MRSGFASTSRTAAAADAGSSGLPREPFLLRALSGIRLDEVLVLQGPPLLGAAFAAGKPTLEAASSLGPFLVASCLLIAHVFLVNDWSDMEREAGDAARRAGARSPRRLDRREARILSGALLAASLLLFAPLGWRTAAIASLIALLSALYSLPACHAKGIPLVNSLLHLAGGTLHFLLGYSLFRGVDLPGVETALFFALTFVAGHLVQEVRDHDPDRLDGYRTNAVVFGKRRTFVAGLATFAAADLLLVALALRGVVPLALALAGLLFPLQLVPALRVLGGGLAPGEIRTFQWTYRALYALFGAFVVVTLWSAV